MKSGGFEEKRTRLIEEIEREANITAKWTGRKAFSPAVMAALATVPRHEFMNDDDRAFAYINRPRGIGFGQTISQPYIVALMSDILDLETYDRVLEIGTGSGYQTAVLAHLARRVFSVEIIPELAAGARTRIGILAREDQAYANIELQIGNGREGWPEHAPYQAIMVTAASDDIPPSLIAQLSPGGRMIVPVGRPGGPQNLMLVSKDHGDQIDKQTILPVAFVPLVKN